MINAFSIDVEEWFCPHYFSEHLNNCDWSELESRLDSNVQRLLGILDVYDVKATFFVLGRLAELHPVLIEKIASKGHEIGIHGYLHKRIFDSTQEDFRRDIELSLTALNKINNYQIYGYRAPCFSVTKNTIWALDILKEFGFVYDSSVYPDNIHPSYGIKGISHDIFTFDNGMIEVPLNSAKFFALRFPCSGGAYFRFYPYSFTGYLLRKVNEVRPFVFYFHPWELDTYFPDIKVSKIIKLRYSYGIRNNEKKLMKLLSEFNFTSIRQLLLEKGMVSYEN